MDGDLALTHGGRDCHVLDGIRLEDPVEFVVREGDQKGSDQGDHHRAQDYQYRLPRSQVVGTLNNVVDRVQLHPDVHIDGGEGEHAQAAEVEV